MKKILTCMMIMIAASAMAESLMQDTYYLDSITYEDSAYSGGVNTLDKTDAKVVEKNRSNNIADFISKDPEISMKRKAAFGDSGDVLSIRGMESKRILLNLDGRNISSTGNVGGNYIDFGTIPLDSIDRIEIIKGGSYCGIRQQCPRRRDKFFYSSSCESPRTQHLRHPRRVGQRR